MTSRVIREGEISLNSKRYPLGGDNRRVRTIVTSQYPLKIVLGDVDKDSNPRSSLVVWDAWSGGVGQYSTDGKEGLNKANFSRANGRYKNHLTLPPLYTAGTDAAAATTTSINEFGSKLYVAVNSGRSIYAYTPSSNSWGSELTTPAASAYQNIAFTLGTTDYVAFAYGTGYEYSSAPDSSWTARSVAVKSFAFWDDRLWGLDNTGQLWFSTTIGTEVNDAKLPLPDGYAHVLFVGPDSSGEDILYASTEVGLWAHDVRNSRFIRTKLRFPQTASADANGVAVQGAATWNGDIYITAGKMNIYRYDPTRGTIMNVGVNEDAGFPVNVIRGDVIKLLPTHTALLAIIDGYSSSDGTVWEYNGTGWHYLTRADASSQASHVSSIGGNYRLYLPYDEDEIGYVALNRGRVNPEVDTISYEGTDNIADHITPWFNAGQNEIDKTAIRIRIETINPSSDETVKVEYALNYSDTYESSHFTVSSSGVATKTFPTIADNNIEAGSVFQAIRFKLTLNRGSTATRTPNIKSLSLEWRRKIPAKYGFAFDIDRTQNYGGRTPKEMKADLITALETSTMVEFTFVSDDGSTQNYYCDVTQMEDLEDTGGSETGTTRLPLVEG